VINLIQTGKYLLDNVAGEVAQHAPQSLEDFIGLGFIVIGQYL
jgi:hypothetical protein